MLTRIVLASTVASCGTVVTPNDGAAVDSNDVADDDVADGLVPDAAPPGTSRIVLQSIGSDDASVVVAADFRNDRADSQFSQRTLDANCTIRTFQMMTGLSAGTLTFLHGSQSIVVPRAPSDNAYGLMGLAAVQAGDPIGFSASGDAFPAFTTTLTMPPQIHVVAPLPAAADGGGQPVVALSGGALVVRWTGAPPVLRVRISGTTDTSGGYASLVCDYLGSLGLTTVSQGAVSEVARRFAPGFEPFLWISAADVQNLSVSGNYLGASAEQVAVAAVLIP